jgi:hypothetical protein
MGNHMAINNHMAATWAITNNHMEGHHMGSHMAITTNHGDRGPPMVADAGIGQTTANALDRDPRDECTNKGCF